MRTKKSPARYRSGRAVEKKNMTPSNKQKGYFLLFIRFIFYFIQYFIQYFLELLFYILFYISIFISILYISIIFLISSIEFLNRIGYPNLDILI